jgi:hypothetical protein
VRARALPWVLLAAIAASGCVSTGDELAGLGEQPPLDAAVLVTGGAFLAAGAGRDGTFAEPEPDAGGDPAGEGDAATEPREVIPIAAVVDVLQRSQVFQRVGVDPDPRHRARASQLMLARGSDEAFTAFLARARADGFDYLLVVEELRDGPIEMQGTNSRWPVTFATWILLGVGMLIPDRTFESRARLRVTLRELQTGRELHDPLLVAGPLELALVERSDFLGVVTSIVVPPFWVGDDPETVRSAVRDVTQRRLLVQLARELKSETVRQRMRDRMPAELALTETDAGCIVTVRSDEALGVARLRGGPSLGDAAADAFARALLASVQLDGGRYRYAATLPPAVDGTQVQVLVGTLRGAVASATFAPRARR